MNDYGVKMPDAIARQSADADALITGNSVAEGTNVVVNTEDFVSANQPASEVIEPVVVPHAPDPNEAYTKLLQQHNVLQGKYNAEVPLLNSANTQLRQEILQLKENQQAMQTIVDTLSRKPADTIDSSNFEDYGLEMVELVDETNALKSELTATKAEIQRLTTEQGKTGQLVEDVGNAVFKSQADVYFADLDKAKPYWETLNKDAQFLTWLSQPDGFSGRTRKDSIVAASKALNSPMVLGIFDTFMQETGWEPTSAMMPGTYDINNIVVPGSIGAGTPVNLASGQAAAGKYTPKDVENASNAYARGKIDEVAFNKVSNGYMLQLKAGS